MTGLVSIAVTSLNSIAQLAVVFKCKSLHNATPLSLASIIVNSVAYREGGDTGGFPGAL